MEISIVTPPGQSGSFTIGSRERGRSLEDLPERHLKLLDEPVTAGMACVNGNGTIHTSPVWVSRDHAEVLLNSVRGRGKSTYPLRDPAGGEVRSLYRVRPDRAQVFGHA